MQPYKNYESNYTYVEAVQWFQNGDHPEDEVFNDDLKPRALNAEGRIVRRYRVPHMGRDCPICNQALMEHGWIDNGDHGYVVCPGDYILQDARTGRYFPLRPEIFIKLFMEI